MIWTYLSKTVSIAMLPQCATAKKWLFDFDYEGEEQVLEFIEDIKNIDSTLLILLMIAMSVVY